MNDFFKMDVFFAVTTAVVVILGILGAVVFYYVIRIMRNVEKVSSLISMEGELMREDIADLRASIRREGFRFAELVRFLGAFGSRRERAKKSETSE